MHQEESEDDSALDERGAEGEERDEERLNMMIRSATMGVRDEEFDQWRENSIIGRKIFK